MSLNSARGLTPEAVATLDRKLKEEAQDPSKQSSVTLLTQWLRGEIPGQDGRIFRPDALVSIMLPRTKGVRDHQVYLSLWTRMAEATLWGKSAKKIKSLEDRCV